MPEMNLEKLRPVVESYGGLEKVPKLLVVPKELFKSIQEDNPEIPVEGFTASLGWDRKNFSPYEIAVVPKGARTKLKLHELGHRKGDYYGKSSPAFKFAYEELSAEAYAYKSMSKSMTYGVFANIIDDVVDRFGLTRSGALRLLKKVAKEQRIRVPEELAVYEELGRRSVLKSKEVR